MMLSKLGAHLSVSPRVARRDGEAAEGYSTIRNPNPVVGEGLSTNLHGNGADNTLYCTIAPS